MFRDNGPVHFRLLQEAGMFFKNRKGEMMCKLIDSACHEDSEPRHARVCGFAQTYPDACPRAMSGTIKLRILAKNNPRLRNALARAQEAKTLDTFPPIRHSQAKEKKSFFDSHKVGDGVFLRTARRQIGRIIRRYIAVLKRLYQIPYEVGEWYRLLSLKKKHESLLRDHGMGQGLLGWPKRCFEENLVPCRSESGAIELCPSPA